jgi:hypothetical protein
MTRFRQQTVRLPTVVLAREAHGGRGRYNVERHIPQHGDAKLTGLLVTLADCPKVRSVRIHDRCKTVDEGLEKRACDTVERVR